MKSTRALKAAGLVLIAVVLGLLTVQGSYALWEKSASAGAGTIQSADFTVSLTDTNSTRVTNMTLPDGTAASLSLTTSSVGAIDPGKSTYAGVQLGNNTNAGGDFTVKAIATPLLTNTGGKELTDYLQVKVFAAPSLTQCNETTFSSSPASSGTAAINIPKAGTGAFCFQVTLAANMPAALSGKTAAVTIPITVTQI